MKTAAALVISAMLPAMAGAQSAPVALVEEAGPESANYGVGLRARYIALPEWFLGIFTDESVALSSAAFGAEFILRRAPDFDWVFAAEYMFASPPDGNWLGNGETAATKTDYIHFNGFGFVNIDATAVWNQKFSRWFTLTYGFGLGVGIPTGDAVRASSTRNGDDGGGPGNAPGCLSDELDDLERCHPPGCGADGICSERELEVMRDERDPHADPDAEAAAFDLDVWPVIPVVHALVGARFTLHRNFELRVDGGFHNALFLGTALQYLF